MAMIDVSEYKNWVSMLGGDPEVPFALPFDYYRGTPEIIEWCDAHDLNADQVTLDLVFSREKRSVHADGFVYLDDESGKRFFDPLTNDAAKAPFRVTATALPGIPSRIHHLIS